MSVQPLIISPPPYWNRNFPEWRQILGLIEFFAKHALSFSWLTPHLEQEPCGPDAQWGLAEPTANKIRWRLQSFPFLALSLWTKMLEHTKLQQDETSSKTGRTVSLSTFWELHYVPGMVLWTDTNRLRKTYKAAGSQDENSQVCCLCRKRVKVTPRVWDLPIWKVDLIYRFIDYENII